MSGIGYQEACEHLSGEVDLRMAVERTKTGTHRLARHQNAWFKAGDERIRWVDAEQAALEGARRLTTDFLRAGDVVDALRDGALRQA